MISNGGIQIIYRSNSWLNGLLLCRITMSTSFNVSFVGETGGFMGICWLDVHAVAGEVNCWLGCVGIGGNELLAWGRFVPQSWLSRMKHRQWWRGEWSGLPCQQRWYWWWRYRNWCILLYHSNSRFSGIKPVYDLQQETMYCLDRLWEKDRETGI